ncbi:hypothetical protein HYU11_03690 [Candidatus Woesearchaeota archaeon]|nr:hypothetical protein [Candidatus Woesearchaeota archaeon]
MRSKKGVSPLIATVLLIAFAVALGAVVMNWGRSYTENTAASVKEKSDVDVKCSLDVKLKVIEYSDKPQICVGEWDANSYINVTLQNIGEKKIEALKVTIFGDSGIFSNTSVPNSTIDKAASTKISAKYPFGTTGTIKMVQIIPVVEIGGKQTSCTGSGSMIEKDIADIVACNSTT